MQFLLEDNDKLELNFKNSKTKLIIRRGVDGSIIVEETINYTDHKRSELLVKTLPQIQRMEYRPDICSECGNQLLGDRCYNTSCINNQLNHYQMVRKTFRGAYDV